MDKVSIIIPVYNSEKNIHGADYLRQAIDSALAQTYKNIEVVVVNDGSKDNGKTEETALSYGDKIKYIKKENGGVSTALNAGIKNAEGEWISWLSHDDLYTPDKIEAQMSDVRKMQEKNADYKRILYYCDGGFINSNGDEIKKNEWTISGGLYDNTDIILKLFKGYSLGGCGLLMPKNMFDEIGGFDEEMRYMQDWIMWVKAFISGYKFFVNNRVMSYTRIHNMQTSTTGKDYYLADRIKIGNYLTENLDRTVGGENIDFLKAYMYCSMRANNVEISNNIYKILKSKGRVNVRDIIGIRFAKMYGSMRKTAITLYYKIRFNTGR